MLRPVLVCLTLSGVGFTTASCGMVEGDPHRFENLARNIADVHLDGSDAGSVRTPAPAAMQTATEQGLRPALAPAVAPAVASAVPLADAGRKRALRVEVMDPHDLWDARDGLRRTIRQESAAMVEGAAPGVAGAAARAVVQQVSIRAMQGRPAAAEGLRPALSHTPAPSISRTTIQLGAYSSEAAARSAWTRINAGAARQSLKGLSPVFERAMVDGRALTRLKVAAPTAAAAAICRAAQVNDPWCARRA